MIKNFKAHQQYLRLLSLKNNEQAITNKVYNDSNQFKSILISTNLTFSFSKSTKDLSKKTSQKPLKMRPLASQIKQQSSKFNPKVFQKSITDPNLFIQMINNKVNINDADKLLNRILNTNVSKKQFQINVWKKYSYYISMIGEKELIKINKNNENEQGNDTNNGENNNLNENVQDKQLKTTKKDNFKQSQRVDNHQIARQNKQKKNRLRFLDSITSVHSKFKGQLTSQHLFKTFNKFVDYFLDKNLWYNLSCSQKVIVLQSLSRYNIKKAYAVFLKKKNQIIKQKQNLKQPEHIIRLLKLMINVDIIDTHIFEEVVIQNLYPEIQMLNLLKIEQIAFLLGKSHKFVNKDFFNKLIKRLQQLSTGQMTDQSQYVRLLHIISSFTLIQKNMQLNSNWFQPLDPVLQRLLPALNYINLSIYKSKYLATFASILRRSQFYDDSILKNLITQSIQRQVIQFNNMQNNNNQFNHKNNKINEHNQIQFTHLIQIFFTLASFNYRNVQFMNYFINLLKIIQQQQGKYQIQLLWSICVLCNEKQIDSLLNMIEHFYKKTQKLQSYDTTNFYYCYLLLKTRYPTSNIRWQNDKIQQYIQGPKHQVQISSIQKQIHSYLIQSGIPALLQYNLNNIICDIYIPKFHQMQHLIIQVHGYHHFARNQKRINGSTKLKQKIIQNQGYFCFYISLDQWLIAEDKKAFVEDFMQEVVRKRYMEKIKSKILKENTEKVYKQTKYLKNQNHQKIKKKEIQKKIIFGQIQSTNDTFKKRLGRKVKKVDLIA